MQVGANGQTTIPISGNYQVSCNWYATSQIGGTGTFNSMKYWTGLYNNTISNFINAVYGQNVSFIVNLSAGTNVSFFIYNGSGVAQTLWTGSTSSKQTNMFQ